MRARREQRGFTLIEQLIGLVVTSIVLALGLPDYSDFIQNRHIRSTANGLTDGLQLARLEAVRRNEAVDFRLVGTDWSVFVPSAGEVVQSRAASEFARAAVALSDGQASITVTFNGMGRITSGNAATTLLVQHVSGSCATFRCMRVQMNAGGQVRACDPQLPSSDPQACA